MALCKRRHADTPTRFPSRHIRAGPISRMLARRAVTPFHLSRFSGSYTRKRKTRTQVTKVRQDRQGF